MDIELSLAATLNMTFVQIAYLSLEQVDSPDVRSYWTLR